MTATISGLSLADGNDKNVTGPTAGGNSDPRHATNGDRTHGRHPNKNEAEVGRSARTTDLISVT